MIVDHGRGARWYRLHCAILLGCGRVLILHIVLAGRQIVIDVVVEATLLLEPSGLGKWLLLLETATLLGRRELILGLGVEACLFILVETEEILLFEIRRFLVEGLASDLRLLCVGRCSGWLFRRRRGRGAALAVQEWQEILLLEIGRVVIETELAVGGLESSRGWWGRAIVAEILILIVNQLGPSREWAGRLIIVDRIAVVEEAAVGIPSRRRLVGEEIVVRLLSVSIVVAVEWRRRRHNRLRCLRVAVDGGVLGSRLVVGLLVLLL